jgi:Transmembrane domain of unknown function (DUF3566)
VGVDHHVEPQWWLPEGAASAITDETTASGEATAAGEQGSRNQDSPNGMREASQEHSPAPGQLVPATGGQESPAPTADPPAYDADGSRGYGQDGSPGYGQDGSPGYGQASPYDYRQEAAYTPDYPAAQSGYNEGVSPPSEESSVPPYPAELPTSAPAAAATKPGLAAAAYRALPKPKAKVRSKTKTRANTKAKTKARTAEGRHANLVIARLEPWSVMKFSFLISLVAWVILFVAVTLLYYALSGLGVFAAIQRTLESVTSSQQSPGVSLAAWTSASRVLGYTMLIGAVDIILITALSTIGAVIYNLVTHLGGGIEITLKETD